MFQHRRASQHEPAERMRRELAAILRHFGAGGQVRDIVVTGTRRPFSAGLDLREAAELPPGGLISDLGPWMKALLQALGG